MISPPSDRPAVVIPRPVWHQLLNPGFCDRGPAWDHSQGWSGGDFVPIINREAIASLGDAITRRIGEPRYNLWFRHTRFAFKDDELVVGVPNRHFQEWLERTFHAAVSESAREIVGQPIRVRFVIDPELFSNARRAQEQAVLPHAADDASPPVESPPPPRPRSRSFEPLPPAKQRELIPVIETSRRTGEGSHRLTRRWHKLADFVVGACNRVAYASAQSVVENLAECANPLVFHGPVGTGKTHLLEGIHAGLRRSRPSLRVLYTTCESFTTRFIQAMRGDRLNGFRKRYRDCDVLLVDDLHFLAKKKATQEEFLHTFDALLSDGRQLVLTCDCHPRLNEDFAPELMDRLLGGAVWCLTPPDAPTRREILRAKANRRSGVEFPDAVLDFLAENLRGNVRELEGAIQGVAHYSRVTSRPVDEGLVREALADLFRHSMRLISIEEVDRAICSVLRMPSGSLQGAEKGWAISHPRMVGMYLARKYTSVSHADIGKYFGGRNHSTVVAAEKKVREWLRENRGIPVGNRQLPITEFVERVERELHR